MFFINYNLIHLLIFIFSLSIFIHIILNQQLMLLIILIKQEPINNVLEINSYFIDFKELNF